jgi:hypothetical protein
MFAQNDPLHKAVALIVWLMRRGRGKAVEEG